MRMLQTNSKHDHQLVGKADRLYQSGLCDAAVDLLLGAIQQSPAEKRLHYALAEILIDSEQYQNALDILNKLPSGSGDPGEMELIGYCKFGLKLFEEADTIAHQILDTHPDSAPALNLKGLLALEKSDKIAAGDFFRKAIAVDSEFGEPYTHLGTLSAEKSNASEAMDFLEKGFLLAPAASRPVLSYHATVQAQNAYERAESIFLKALEHYPFNKRLVYLLIDIFLQQSKFDRAIQAIERAIVNFGSEDGILDAALKIRDRLGPLGIDANPNRRVTVSLCMITKNEENYLAKCLASAKALVDEIIVVDTGSTDRTRDIAAVFGARVFDFQWDEDFSKARNFSISKASGDWILILDADEVISSRDADNFLDIIRSRNPHPVAFSIVTRNYTMQANTIGWVANDGKYGEEEAGAGWIASQKVRLFKNDPQIRFEYPVHEMVDPALRRSGIPIENFPIPVHHYGKLNQTAADRKTEHYYAIGRKKLEEMGGNIVAIRELAIQAGHLQKHAEAIELWQRYLKQKPDDPEAYVNLGTARFNLGNYDQAAISAQKAMSLAPSLKEAHFNYAICQLHLGNAGKSAAVLENILKQYPRYPAAQFMLAAAYTCEGQKNKALTEFEKIRRTEVGPMLAVTFCDLAERLTGANQQAFAVALLETAVSGNMANENLIRLLNKFRNSN